MLLLHYHRQPRSYIQWRLLHCFVDMLILPWQAKGNLHRLKNLLVWYLDKRTHTPGSNGRVLHCVLHSINSKPDRHWSVWIGKAEVDFFFTWLEKRPTVMNARQRVVEIPETQRFFFCHIERIIVSGLTSMQITVYRFSRKRHGRAILT